MAKYNILIKSTGASKDLFKFYLENGQPYETSSLTDLKTMYESLLETNPKAQVIPIHNLDVTLNTVISE